MRIFLEISARIQPLPILSDRERNLLTANLNLCKYFSTESKDKVGTNYTSDTKVVQLQIHEIQGFADNRRDDLYHFYTTRIARNGATLISYSRENTFSVPVSPNLANYNDRPQLKQVYDPITSVDYEKKQPLMTTHHFSVICVYYECGLKSIDDAIRFFFEHFR